MTDRIEKILGVLDNATQQSPEQGYTRLAAPEACWRCDCALDNDSPTELCTKCIGEMQKERPAAPSIESSGARIYVALDSGWSPPMAVASLRVRYTACRMHAEDACSPEFPCVECPRVDAVRIRSSELVGAFPDVIPDNPPRPIRGCAFVDPEDGTCAHPAGMTPECWRLEDGDRSDCPPLDAAGQHDPEGMSHDAHVRLDRIRAEAFASSPMFGTPRRESDQIDALRFVFAFAAYPILELLDFFQENF